MNNLFIKKIEIAHDQIPNQNIYPFNIEIIKKLKVLNLEKNVTFLIGDYGVGKSTFIESLIVLTNCASASVL
jgi:predicted ATPase